MYRFLFFILILPALLSAEKPDLLLITIDTLRADHLGSYGNQKVRTPNLDALAKRSLFFENALCPAPLTLPSHTSLMTGRYPIRHGIHDNAGVVDPKETTLAEILRANGYHTYAFVGGFPLDHRFGLNQGFDLYDDVFPRQKNRSLDFRSERDAGDVVKAVLQTPVKRPFFVWVHFYDPHAPYLHNGYAGEIEFVDKQIGILLKRFEKFSPVIAVAGDHGESLGEHGEWTHRIFIYDSTMKVPFWIAGPGFPPQKIREQARLVDFVPTILNAFKIKPPAGLDGVVLPGGAGQVAYLESLFPQLELGWSPLAAVRTREWKYIQAPKPELYDLKSDPAERNNLYAKRRDIAKKLQAQMPASTHSPSANTKISPEMAEQLASLGYVGSGSNAPQSNIDPKDRIHIWNQIERAVDLESTRPAESIAVLESVLKKDPENPMILGFLAQKYAEGGRLQEARGMLSRVLAGNRNNALALYRMASVCLKLREPLEAKKWAEALRSIEKGNADALILLAQTNLALGQPQQAIENLHAALRLDPRDLDLRNDLGNLYLESKQPEKANEQFKLVLKADPGNVQALNGAAMCDYTGGNLQTAEASLVKALRIQPRDPQTRMNLALLYSRQNRKEEAIRLYRDIISSSDTPADWKEEASRRLNKLQ